MNWKRKKSKEILAILITESKNTQPLLGLDWLNKLAIGLQGGNNTNVIRHVEEDERREKIINEYENLFKNNQTIKDLTTDIQLKKDVKPIQQRGRPVPIHFQKLVREELEKLIEQGHLEKADKTTVNGFISPAVITIKKDKSVKIALDSRKLNEACIKRKAAMPNMEALISKISAKNSKGDGDIWMSKSTWITPMAKQNYLKKQPNIVFSRLLEVTLPDITVSRKVFMAYLTSSRYSKSI